MLGVEYDEEMPFLPAFPYYFYKITCNDTNIKKCYIGKTKDLKARTAAHKSNCIHRDIKLYQVIREHGGWTNWTLSLYHKCVCDERASVYIEVAIIKQFKEQGYEMLNCQLPVDYKNQEYNKMKCKEHYAVKVDCECGWSGSKMELAHHKQSKRHSQFSLKKFEEDVLKSAIKFDPETKENQMHACIGLHS